MTGTASISREQLKRIDFEIRLWENVEPKAEILTVDIHPSLTKMGVVRVLLHRKGADSRAFGITRDGSMIPSAQAA